MSESSGFELEDANASPEKSPPPKPGVSKPAASQPRTTPAEEPLVSDRRRGRLLRQVPGFAVGFLLVGWICLGTHAWPFAVTGAAMGAWAGWLRRGEVVVGSVAAVVGLATYFAIVGFLPGMGMGIVIVGCGVVGYLAGLDDRFRGA